MYSRELVFSSHAFACLPLATFRQARTSINEYFPFELAVMTTLDNLISEVRIHAGSNTNDADKTRDELRYKMMHLEEEFCFANIFSPVGSSSPVFFKRSPKFFTKSSLDS